MRQAQGYCWLGRGHTTICTASGAPGVRGPPQFCGGSSEYLLYGVVELADALEPGRECDISDRDVGGLEQRPGGLRPLGPRQRKGAGPDLAHKHAVKLAFAVPEPFGQPGDAVGIDRPVEDELHRACGHVCPPQPLRRPRSGVRAAPQAGAKTILLRGCRARVKAHMVAHRRAGRAAGTAVDPGGSDCSEKPAVKARVTALNGSIASFEIVHRTQLLMAATDNLAVFGHRHAIRAGPKLWPATSDEARVRSLSGPGADEMARCHPSHMRSTRRPTQGAAWTPPEDSSAKRLGARRRGSRSAPTTGPAMRWLRS